jgi:tetratricopeptide (TPR) repeat protein
MHPLSSKAAELSQRVSAAIPDRKGAAGFQRHLRAYRPAWELAQQPEVLEALLVARGKDPLWWRPARMGLIAIGVWRGLEEVGAVEAWLDSEGGPLLGLAAGEIPAEGMAPELVELLRSALVRDVCLGVRHHREGESSAWGELDEGVLVCLYDMASRQTKELPWLVSLARHRPETAARMLVLNHGPGQQFAACRPIAVVLPAPEALAFVRALEGAGVPEVAAALAQELLRRLGDTPQEETPAGLAEAAVRSLYRGLTAAVGDGGADDAVRELESAWGSGRKLAATLALELGRLHQSRSDALAALSAYQLGLEMVPADSALRAGAAAALNDLGKHHEALDLLDTAPASQGAEYELAWQRAQALAGLGEQDDALVAASRAADRFSTPEQRYQVAHLLAELGEEYGAALLMEQALSARPDQAKWYGELGELYAAQSQWRAALDCYRQQVVLESEAELVPALLQLSAAQRAVGDPVAALETVTEAVQRQPKEPAVLHEWMLAAHAAGEWHSAVQAGHSVLSLEPDQLQVHVLMGEAYEALGQGDEALYHLRRATQLPFKPSDPEPAAAWLALGSYYERRGDLAQVEETLEEGVQMIPQAMAEPLLFRLGLIYEESGRLTEAQATYSRLYQAGCRSCALLTRLGRVLGSLGHRELAIVRLEEGAARSDADGAVYHALALALEGADRGAEAAAAARQAAALEGNDGQILLDAGRLSLKDGDVNSAVDLLRAAAERLPDSAEAWEWLARSHEGAGDWAAALDAYWLAARLNAANPSLQYRIGIAYTRLGQYETAITALQEAASRMVDDPTVKDALAEALEAAGFWGKAATIRQQAADLTPTDIERLVAWARAARQSGDHAYAEEALVRARGVAPNDERLALEKASLQRARGDRAGAVQILRDLVRESRQPELLWRAGDELMELGQPESGAGAFARAVDLDPSDPVAQAKLGHASSVLGDYAQALAAYQAAAQLEPGNSLHLVAIGEMYWQLGDASQAAAEWEKALSQRADDASLMARLGAAYAAMKDPAAALAMYERAGSLPSLAKGEAGRMWREAGRAALELAELDKAQLCLARALQELPKDPEVHSLVGALAHQLGKPKDAVDAYRRAVELAPRGGQRAYQLQLADALTEQGRELDALEVWQVLVDESDASDETVAILGQMGRLYARAGRFASAERTLRSALVRSPEDGSLQLELAAVLVELGEEADYQRRAELPVADNRAELERGVTWLGRAGDESGPQVRRDLARGRLLLGGVNEAILALKAYLTGSGSAAASDLKAQRALGVAYRRAGMLEASQDILANALKVAPNDVRTAVELAQTHLAAGRPLNALTLLEQMAEGAPEDSILLYHYAAASQAAGKTAKAIKTLEEAVEMEEGPGRWRRRLADWLRRSGDPMAALAHAQAAAEESPSAATQGELGRVLGALGRNEEAAAAWREALQLDPEDPDGWAALGELLLESEQAEEAAGCYERAVQVGRDAPMALHYLGWAQAEMALGRMGVAEQTIKMALGLDADLPAAHAVWGDWYAAQGDWQQALVHYQTSVMRSGANGAAPPEEEAGYLVRVARAYRALGSREQALQVLERAAKLAPAMGAVYALIGEIYQEAGSKDLARQAFQQAAKVGLSNPRYVLRLAQFLQNEGQLDQALDWLVKANGVRPSAALWVETARIYRQRSQRGKQLEALHRAVALEPDSAEAHFELGLAYKQRKEYQLAIEEFEKSVALEPDDQRAHKQLSAVVAISLAGTLRGKKG